MLCAENPEAARCKSKCGVLRDCGHPCNYDCVSCTKVSSKGKLNECVTRSVHGGVCKKTCGRILLCGHTCPKKCHPSEDCPPCRVKCSKSCPHKQCSGTHTCGDGSCTPCTEPCMWDCEHIGGCKLICG